MKKIEFITPSDAEFGFSLCGIPQKIAETTDVEDVLTQTMADSNIGLAVVDERLLTGMPDERLRELEESWQGIFLVLPSPEKPPPETEDYAARLIRRAIGYHVRLKL